MLELDKWRQAENIIDKLNQCAAEIEDAGETFIECVIDARADEGLPPFTAEELATAKAECDRNADTVTDLEAEMDSLRLDYFGITGSWPHYSDFTNRYYT